MKIFKFIIVLTGMLATITVATISSVYMLSGFSKEKCIALIDKIPADRFGWWVLIPILLISFFFAIFFWFKLIKICASNSPPGNVHLQGFVDEHLKNNTLHVIK